MKKLPIVHAIIPAFVTSAIVIVGVAGAAACDHPGERGEGTSIDGFVGVPIALTLAHPDDGGTARDGGTASASEGSTDAGAAAALEPIPPAGKACQTIAACRPESDAVDPHAVAKDLARCAPTDDRRGAFSVRETREARAHAPGVEVCCYVRFDDCI